MCRSRRKQTKKKGQWGIRLGGVTGLTCWSNGSASVSPSVGFAEWLEPFQVGAEPLDRLQAVGHGYHWVRHSHWRVGHGREEGYHHV